MSVHQSAQHTSQDTLRWGDTFTWQIPAAGGPPTGFNIGNRQLAQARWRWPITWQVLIIGNPMFSGSEGANFVLSVAFTIGVGQSTAQFSRTYQINAPNYTPIADLFQVPAQDLQATAFLEGIPQSGVPETFQVGVFCAPLMEPHAMTLLLDELAKDAGERNGGWMGPGFNPEELAYRR